MLISAAIFLIALLYSSVGHAGASGYIAVMTLFGLAPEVIKPTALMLNILVAGIALWQFHRAGFFSRHLFLVFAVSSVPFAYLGGYIHVSSVVFRVLVGLVLLYSAVYFLFKQPDYEPKPPLNQVAIPIGAGLGFLSGLVGVGGGIFLTPLLILARWAPVKKAAAVSAAFILVNSVSGLLGSVTHSRQWPSCALPMSIAAVLGGTLGAHLGSRYLSVALTKQLLAVVLIIAGIKLLFIT